MLTKISPQADQILQFQWIWKKLFNEKKEKKEVIAKTSVKTKSMWTI